MTQPDGANPNGALNPTRPNSFLEFQQLTQADIFNKSKAPIVGTTGSATRAQRDIAATDGNVIPNGGGLWKSFTRDADATFPRILLAPRADRTGSGGSGDNAHAHSISFDDPPDYQPPGHGTNWVELGFIECSKDRSYSRISFGTGNAVTAAGIAAMYAGAYLMNSDTGALQLMAATGDITGAVANTNQEYTFNIPTVDALKSEIWAVGLLQVTVTGQTCKSVLAKQIWSMSAPPGFKPAALYASAGTSGTLPTSLAYSALVFKGGLCPYYALS